jgi:YidC/Oxa1 family membrane protein insertase
MEEKKFDIKSLIGFTLIFGILMWMMYSNQPSKEELAEKAKKEQAEKIAKIPSVTKSQEIVSPNDTTAIAATQYQAKYGAFANAAALSGTKNATTVLANKLLRLTVANKGGYITEATVLNEEQFKKGSGKAVKITIQTSI